MSRRSDSNNDKSIKYNDKDYRENNDLYNRQHNRNVSSDTVESSTFSSDSDDSDKNERKGKKGSDGIIKIKKVKVNTAAENTQLKRVKSESGKLCLSVNPNKEQNQEEKEKIKEPEENKQEPQQEKQKQQTESNNKNTKKEKRAVTIFDNKTIEPYNNNYYTTVDIKTKPTPTPRSPIVFVNPHPPASSSSSSSSIFSKIIKAMFCCCKIKKIFKRSEKNSSQSFDDEESGRRNNNNRKEKKNRNCCLIIILILIIIFLLGNLIVLDVAMVKNTLASSASNSNITQVIYSPPTNDTSSDPVAKQLEIKIRSVVCMSMLAGLPPKQFPCEFCTKDFEPAFNNVTSFCVLKGIWANSNNATSLEQNLKWMGDSNYCEWIGVTCGPNSQNIIGLDIRFPNTPKVLLNDIGKLTSLQTLSISGDAKIPSGVIPPSIFQLEALNTLRIESTLLSGPVPDTFDKMTSLTTLQLIRNVQLGAVPKSIGTLSLTTLAISQQGLTGAIPDFIGQSETLQANLQNLDLSINQLTGNIPESLMQLKALKTLNLNTNLLSGDIPATLAQSNFQNTLTVLDLGANAFQNKIPDSISTIKNLLTLSLGKNSLNGQIPASLVKLVKLSDLVLNDNQLTGNIPDGIGGLNIVNLILTNNTMTGVVPTSVCQRQYTTCDLTLTGLTSPVKCAVCKLPTPPATTPPATPATPAV